MLPHYSPLSVAERFSILSGLYPGRVDLGIGRAPGTDQLTMLALQRDRRQPAPDDFPAQLTELLAKHPGIDEAALARPPHDPAASAPAQPKSFSVGRKSTNPSAGPKPKTTQKDSAVTVSKASPRQTRPGAAHTLTIKYLGLWDTVSALGVPAEELCAGGSESAL